MQSIIGHYYVNAIIMQENILYATALIRAINPFLSILNFQIWISPLNFPFEFPDLVEIPFPSFHQGWQILIEKRKKSMK